MVIPKLIYDYTPRKSVVITRRAYGKSEAFPSDDVGLQRHIASLICYLKPTDNQSETSE